MLIRRLLVAGSFLLFTCALSVNSYGADYASVKELCAASYKEFQKINQLKGFMPDQLSDADYQTILKAAEVMVANESVRQSKFNLDANTTNISKLVATHAGRIVDRAKGSKEGLIEDVGHNFRFLTLSCKSCHKMYPSEAGLAP